MASIAKRTLWAALALALALLVAACGGPAATSNPGLPLGPIDTPEFSGLEVGPEVGKLAPNFRLETTDGKVVALSDFRGKPVLLNFWATWCPPCRFEMPEMQKVHEKLGAEGLVILAVDLQEPEEVVVAYKKELGLTFTTPLDRDARVSEAYSLLGLPATFLIDRNGVVQAIKIGAFADEADLMRRLQKIL